jgi:hypothetical protein
MVFFVILSHFHHNSNIVFLFRLYMLEFMTFKCKGCGYYVDCNRKDYEEREGMCEDCHEKKDE